MSDRKLAFVIACVAGLSAITLPVHAATQSAISATRSLRDGSHDLDFDIGTWRVDITRFRRPFVDPTQTMHLSGTITVRPIWARKAEVEQIEVDGPGGHWEAASLYLYDPTGHQWSRNYANSADGRLDGSPKIGEFQDGKLVLYSQDTFEGRAILVRETFYGIRRNSHDYEEDYSTNGGGDWRPAFKAHMTRIAQ